MSRNLSPALTAAGLAGAATGLRSFTGLAAASSDRTGPG